MKIFLETSVLSDVALLKLTEELIRRASQDELFISALNHFEVLVGYRAAKRSSSKYNDLLKSLNIEVVPVTRTDSESATGRAPVRRDLVDSLVAASAERYEAEIWTRDSDFLRFLPKDRIRLIK